jgi:hypothetical protein
MAQEKAIAAVILNDASREFFKKIKFHEIPAEAGYVCFLEDGAACFIEDIEFGLSMTFPKFAFFSYYEDILVEIIDE